MYRRSIEGRLKCQGKESGEQDLRVIDSPSRFGTAETAPLLRCRLAPAGSGEEKLDERIVLPPGIRRGRGGLDSRRGFRRLLRRQRRNQQRMIEAHRLSLFQNPLGAAKEDHVHGPSLYAKRVNRR